jgi:hypothetical protein
MRNQRLCSALLTAAVVAVADPVLSAVWAKPPDLPIDGKVVCKEESRQSLNNVGVYAQPVAPALPVIPETTEDQTDQYRVQFGDWTLDLSWLGKAWQDDWQPALSDLLDTVAEDPARAGVRLVNGVGELMEAACALLGDLGGVQTYCPAQTLPVATYLANPPLYIPAACEPTHAPLAGAAIGEAVFGGIPPVGYNTATVQPAVIQTGGCRSVAVPVAPGSCNPSSGMCHRPTDAAEANTEECHRQHAAEHLMQVGMNCQDRGDEAMARNCYEEVQRLCPSGDMARAATKRIKDMLLAHAQTQSREEGSAEAEEMPLIRESREDVRRIQESKRMYHLGQRYEDDGDADNAYRCYQEANQICPACRWGRQARERVRLIEEKAAEQNHESGVEQQEPPVDHKKPMSDGDWQKREEAHHLFLLGEHCRRGGDLRMAVEFYQETHMTYPDCYYGWRAMERIGQIERDHRPPLSTSR